MMAWVRGVGGLLVAVMALAGCDAQPAASDKPSESGKPSASGKASKSAKRDEGSDSAAAGFAAASVAAGESGGVWTGAFRAKRMADDAGKTYLQAAEACRDGGMELCTEIQWSRICESDATLGALASWTASWAGDVVVVRGGGGCDARKTVAASEVDAERAGVCCERAIGITTKNDSAAFVTTAHADQLRFERAINAQDLTALDDIFGRGVFMEGKADKGMTHEAAMKAQKSWFAAHPRQWTLYDTCDAAVADIICPVPAGKSLECPGLVMDCTMINFLGDELTVVKQRVGWWKDEGEPKNHVWDIRHGQRLRKLGKL